MEHPETKASNAYIWLQLINFILIIQCYVSIIKWLIKLARLHVRDLTPGSQKNIWQWMMKQLNATYV